MIVSKMYDDGYWISLIYNNTRKYVLPHKKTYYTVTLSLNIVTLCSNKGVRLQVTMVINRKMNFYVYFLL